MALSESEILQVLEMFDRSGWSEMQLHSGSHKLLISKTGRIAGGVAPSPPPLPPATAPAVTAAPPPAATAAVVPAAEMVDPAWASVKAPMLGHYYAGPSPGAPPFVTVGQQVTAEDTVAILEVMKLMTHVKAGASGKVTRIAVNNGDLVEFEQDLLYIDPAG